MLNYQNYCNFIAPKGVEKVISIGSIYSGRRTLLVKLDTKINYNPINKRMKHNLLTFLILMLSVFTMAQNDTLYKEIMNYSDSKTDIIIRGRKMVLDKFLENDWAKVKQVKDYLANTVSDRDYSVFYPAELWLIEYSTQEYSVLLSSINSFDKEKEDPSGSKIYPSYDLLYKKMLEHTDERQRSIIKAIQNSNDLADIDKDFLVLNLKFLLSKKSNIPNIGQDSLNILADNYLKKYPANHHADFVRKNIRIKYIPSKWAGAFELFSGYGFCTGDLSQKFNSHVPIGVAFDIDYNRFTLFLRDYIGIGSTSEDVYINSKLWKKGSRLNLYLPEASLGYVAFDSRLLKVAPFAGISSTNIVPPQNDINSNPDLKNVELAFTTTYTFGLNIDIKLGKNRVQDGRKGREVGNGFLRLRYAYNMPQFSKAYPGFGGNMHYITVGLGAFGRRIHRAY